MSTLFVLFFLVTLICLPISLMAPSLFGRITNGSRKRATQIFGGALLVLFVLIGVTAPDKTENAQGSAGQTKENIVSEVANPEEKKIVAPTIALATPTDIPTPTATLTPSPTHIPTSKPTAFPTVKKLQPTAIPTAYIPATSAPVQPSTSGGFSCNCAKTCSQMSSCAEAQYQLNDCGCNARDADNDGVACDSDCQ